MAVRAVVSVPPQHGKSQLLLHHLVRFVTTQPQKQSAYMGYGIEFARDQAPQAAIIEREATPRAPETDDQHLGYQQRGYLLNRDRRTADRAEGRRHPDRRRSLQESTRGRIRGSPETGDGPVARRRFPRVNPGASVILVQARWTDSADTSF